MDAAIYCRISSDATGEAAGVTRQERECRELATRRGLTVVEVLVDNDISAFSGKHRPAYARLLDQLHDGELDAVIAWHPDRLHRSLRELEEFIAVIDEQKVDVHTVTAGDVDLGSPIGRMIARQLGTFARYESEHRSERVKAAHLDLALRGKWKGGPRPYGYDLVRDAAGNPTGTGNLVPVPSEVRIIREATRRVLAGDTVYSICRDLNRRGVPTSRGGPWRVPTMHGVLTGPTIAGQRAHYGKVVAPASWPAIVSLDEALQLRARLAGPRIKWVRPHGRYLLTGGLLLCGRCGARMYTRWRHDTGRRAYYCGNSVDKDGCGRLQITADPLDDHVLTALFNRLGHDTMNALVANPKALRRELSRRAELEARLRELAAIYASGLITRQEWLIARGPLTADLAVTPRHPAHLGGLRLGDATCMRTEWDQLDLDRRKALLRLTIDAVIVRPASRRGPYFDPTRADVHWR